MDASTIKQDYQKVKRHFPAALPLMGWYFAATKPRESIVLPPDEWVCMFQHIYEVARGATLCFSVNSYGCNGAACYFGFKQPGENAGGFLASKEKY